MYVIFSCMFNNPFKNCFLQNIVWGVWGPGKMSQSYSGVSCPFVERILFTGCSINTILQSTISWLITSMPLLSRRLGPGGMQNIGKSLKYTPYIYANVNKSWFTSHKMNKERSFKIFKKCYSGLSGIHNYNYTTMTYIGYPSTLCPICCYWKLNFPMSPSVGWLVGRLVCHNFKFRFW